jgi:hypothetical protein
LVGVSGSGAAVGVEFSADGASRGLMDFDGLAAETPRTGARPVGVTPAVAVLSARASVLEPLLVDLAGAVGGVGCVVEAAVVAAASAQARASLTPPSCVTGGLPGEDDGVPASSGLSWSVWSGPASLPALAEVTKSGGSGGASVGLGWIARLEVVCCPSAVSVEGASEAVARVFAARAVGADIWASALETETGGVWSWRMSAAKSDTGSAFPGGVASAKWAASAGTGSVSIFRSGSAEVMVSWVRLRGGPWSRVS